MNSDTAVCISYGSFSLFLSILHNVFLLYHVETFLSIYHINQSAFWIGEALFLVWNSFNDQLFGWLSDRSYLTLSKSYKSRDVVIHRVKLIRMAGPFMAFSFMLFWYQILPVGLQFALCLCLYDSMLTIVDLQQSALVADLAVSSFGRVRLVTFSAVFNAMGSLSVFLSYLFWDRNNMFSFQLFSLCLGLFSALGFYISSRFLIKQFSTENKSDFQEKENLINSSEMIESSKALHKYMQQISSHKNFLWFTAMNLIQVFNCHFNSNFFPLFLEVLLNQDFAPSFSSLVLGISFLAPHLNNIYFMHLCQKWGTYSVVRVLFILKIILCLILLIFGVDYIYLLVFFIASNRIFTEGTCKLLNLVISDLVDEDMVINKRTRSISALIFGTSALLSKPGQTLAPIIGTWLITFHTGKDIFKQADRQLWLRSNEGGEGFNSQQLGGFKDREACFALLVWVPLVCALIQLLLWSCFTLRGQRLRRVKQLRSSKDKGPYQQII